ncbi:5-methyltetrahydropteroyltriglutamate--homocysteine S-methyltransferase [Candidatus Pantoea edessiphila]|uniref:5-methyltetrahydropteroyltriglutamate--homocysteine methyltransferase n=1 Tax=Candidatus Pantoea edessiphila TaxID=2044610 RepID=A0A2P5SXC5_9GAMM|nr:5-methyltetrahydropteroyltriglutamate--homocysteine S-methyltransferase [Candidatus Pantoea edessiphila]MBK4775925.1 5-methyltetrahydropteroyltriglutamate--homocysteine S-methyltransferase [Pantoea sp. Edef]PPI86989.1 5-methyltetrahydropteroyltriglutamate--homocysteine S-methyltransferase [Candidatus Pantoea edessiphila]
MAILNHTLGFPRIGARRELKKALENYWRGNIDKTELLKIGFELRKRHWEQQKKAGIDILPVGDFAWYDHVLTTSLLLGNIPKRHKNTDDTVDLDTLFFMARGVAPNGRSSIASEMTKWFNTNYHYIVPEFEKDQNFKITWTQLFEEIDEALSLNYQIKVVLLGPITYLWLGKTKVDNFNKLSLLENLISVYQCILSEIIKRGVKWIQIEEPILSMEISKEWSNAFKITYEKLYLKDHLLLTTYFDGISQNIKLITQLPVKGVHVDVVYGKDDIQMLNNIIPESWILSLGVINGRNIWRSNLTNWFYRLKGLIDKRQFLWIGTSCSLLHIPIDLSYEKHLEEEVRNWFAFGLQKCKELTLLRDALNKNDKSILEIWSKPIISHPFSTKVSNHIVQKRVKNILEKTMKRIMPYQDRVKLQHKRFNLPNWPTTTIGSFPQTDNIRNLRLNLKKGKLNNEDYQKNIFKNIKNTILEQERLNIDVLVHGESERNDMVEYFSEHLDGFIFTQNGWIQSYGSRCVKPPIIIGDVSRPKDITIEYIKYAQSLTKRPVKGMITGPITILCWSFVREDIPRATVAKQIALALRDEVESLEKIGIGIIQIDEPALREGLPLHKSNWQNYLKWAIDSFHISSSVVKDNTQIHTHMCYCEFNDIIDSIVELDADVITIETARSNMKLLQSFESFEYPNGIGPGVYDIHSPNIPSIKSITTLLKKAAQYIPKERLWVNPDCGLKTRDWIEVRQALKNMVEAAMHLRNEHMKKDIR